MNDSPEANASEALAALPLFAGLSPAQLEGLSQLLELENYPAGSQIFAAGDRSTRLYILRAGEVAIRYKPYDGDPLDITTIGPGGAFGWSAALKRSYYTCAALARTDVQVLAINAHKLHQHMARDSELSGVLLERAAEIASSRFDSLGREVMRLLKPKRRARLARSDAPNGNQP